MDTSVKSGAAANCLRCHATMYKIKLSPYAKIFYTEWMLDSNSARYNVSIDQTLYGKLDIKKLRNALKRYVVDHVVLNSHIQEFDEEPHWVKNDNIEELESSEHPANTFELLEYIRRSFNLHSGPLYRFKLFRIKDDVYRFIVVMHHVIVDGSSLDSGVFGAISNYYNYEHYTKNIALTSKYDFLQV